MAYLSITPRLRFFDANGAPLSGGKLYTFEAGTVTPKATYTDADALSPNTNPIILDGEGYCDCWLDSGSFKFRLDNASDVTQWTVDDIKSISQLVTDQVNTEGALAVLNNLSDLDDSDAALVNLGLTATATELNYTDGVTSAIQTQLDANASDLSDHESDTANPHSVTATQVGLGNVDNTSDADKPVSDATQTALDLKFDSADVIDEDDMSSDSATKVPTQQSVKAYVDVNVGPGSVPVGSVIMSANTSTPGGFLYCNGGAVSRTTYSTLYAIIGDSFGEGDGSTTFNVPDMRGLFPRGMDDGSGNDPDAASRAAANTGGNTGDNIGSEQGYATALPNTDFTTDSDSHYHQTGVHANDGSGEVRNAYASRTPRLSSGTSNRALYASTSSREEGATSSDAHTHDITGGGDNETRPTNLAFKFYIKY